MFEDLYLYMKNFLKTDTKNSLVYSIHQTTTYKIWFLLGLCVLILGLLAGWAFMGEIPITLTGKGIIISKGGLSVIHSTFEGPVNQILVKPGEKIKSGDLLLQGKEDNQKIYSKVNGLVLEILVEDGDMVREGTTVILIENPAHDEAKDPYVVFGYFPLDTGKRLSKNSPIKITIPSLSQSKYGKLSGNIQSISLFAVSKDSLLADIHNQSLVDFLTSQAPAVIRVVIEPVYESPDKIELTSGTLVNLEATVEKVRPIYYLLPIEALKNFHLDEKPPLKQINEVSSGK